MKKIPSVSIYSKGAFQTKKVNSKEKEFYSKYYINFKEDDMKQVYKTLKEDFKISNDRIEQHVKTLEFFGFGNRDILNIQFDNKHDLKVERNKEDLHVIKVYRPTGRLVRDKFYIGYFN